MKFCQNILREPDYETKVYETIVPWDYDSQK